MIDWLRCWAAGSLILIAFTIPVGATPLHLDSREYKVGLDVAQLPAEPVATAERVRTRLTEGAAEFAGIRFSDARKRTVRFFDLDDCTLHKSSILLRTRKVDDKPMAVTVKARSHDLLLVQAMPLTLARDGKTELEDDYSMRGSNGPRSDFSLSLTYEGTAPGRLEDIVHGVRGLTEIVHAPISAQLIGGPVIAESVFRSNDIPMRDGTSRRLVLSLWHDSANARLIAGDLSFTVETPVSYATVRAAGALLDHISVSLGSLVGATGEKALSALPGACR